MRIRFAGAVIMRLTLAVSSPAHADRLDDMRKAGVLYVATFDTNPPSVRRFEHIRIILLDVDYARPAANPLA